MKKRLYFLGILLFLTACSGKESGQFAAPEFLRADVAVKGAEATFVCELSGNRVEQCGIVLEDRPIEGKMQGQAFTVTAGGLETGRTYTWSAFAKAGGSEITTPVQEFTAPDGNVPIPDPAFKNYLLGEYDADGDGDISVSEARFIWRISFCTNELNVKSLSGIEYMPNLEEINCVGDFLQDFDLGNREHYYLSKKYHLGDKYGPIGTLETIDVSHNPELRVLRLYNNAALGENMRTLDLSRNLKLTFLDLGMTALQMPDVSHLPGLTELLFTHLWGPFPDLKPFSQLRKLDISFEQTGRRIDVDVSHCPYLEELIVAHTARTLSELSYNPELMNLSVKCCDFSSIDLSALTHLRFFDGSEGHLRSVDVSANPELTYLDLSPMTENLLETLYIAPGQKIPGVTENRSEEFIPAYTQIVEKSVE